jgi:transcriptional regulator with XRE-family HTH domain
MFAHLGPALVLLRELRGKSQARVAREAGIGKSQLSQYETGKDLPKLDSLEKVLTAFDVGHLKLFSMLDLVDRRAADLFPQRCGPRAVPSGVLPEEMTAAFHRALTVLLELHQQVLGDEVRRHGAETR